MGVGDSGQGLPPELEVAEVLQLYLLVVQVGHGVAGNGGFLLGHGHWQS